MKNKIKEVENYFKNKILTGDVELKKAYQRDSQWLEVKVSVDGGFVYKFSIRIVENPLFVIHDGLVHFRLTEEEEERVKTTYYDPTKHVSERIEQLKNELKKLEDGTTN